MYQSSHSAEHSQAGHVQIVDALARGDADEAVRLMEAHIAEVESNLRLHLRIDDLATALASAASP